MAAIKLLDAQVYELIAAGEVIENPNSVIKELLENAIDAGATSVTIEIKNGGRTFMRVTDNGCGIESSELPTAFLHHATSKVSSKSDLDSISTLGFRGEALASVCAVSRVEVFTKTADAELGTRFEIAAGKQMAFESVGCPNGTSIIVRDLFYNVPARLKFLKKDSTEANRIQELVSRLAISHPEVSLKLIRDNKPVFVTAGDGRLYSAIYSVLGREFVGSLLPISYSLEGATVTGYISKPLVSRSNRKLQLFYINGRYVHSEVCSKALEEGYRNSIMTGRFPACVISITLAPELVDVNVHPAKTEVRFSDNRYVYDSVYFAVKEALEKKDTPTRMSLDTSKKHYTSDTLYVKPQEPKPEQMVINLNKPKENDDKGDDLFLSSLEEDSKPWKGVLKPMRDEQPEMREPKNSDEPKAEDVYLDKEFEQLCEQYDEPEQVPEPKPDEPKDEFKYVSADDFKKREPTEPIIAEDEAKHEDKPVVVGELFKTYIVAQCGDEMLLIDKHAAHERYIFEQIKNDSRNLSSQTLLEPIMVMLSFDEYDAIVQSLDKVAQLGFIIDPDVAPNIAVTGLPALLADENPTDVITEIAQKLSQSQRDPAPDLYDDLYHTMACRAAIKAHDDTSLIELQRLAESVFEEDIRYCPHGRPVMIRMSQREIEKQFKRIV